MSDWEIVSKAWNDEAPECDECPFRGSEYWSDTGFDTWCELGDISGHEPGWCLAYDRIKEEMEEDA